jgi:preprotein translocase subunit SecE
MPATPASFDKHEIQSSQVSKSTWPSKKETFTTSGIVLVVISIAAVILMLLDQFFAFIVRVILG